MPRPRPTPQTPQRTRPKTVREVRGPGRSTDAWQLVDLKEKWGHISAVADPASGWRHGALWLFSAASGNTCARCGRPARMRDHCKGHFGVLPLCDPCDAQWQVDERTPDGHIRRIISDQAAREGREVDVDAELARLRDRRI